MAKKRKVTPNKVILLSLAILLSIFFILWGDMHIFLANLTPHLHFCSYFYCVIFSLIWFVLALIIVFLLTKKVKIGKVWYISYAIILIIGLILMNVTSCDVDGKMSFGFISLAQSVLGGDDDSCVSGVDCPDDIVEVPIPPCIETDSGRDYITSGMILSGADIEDMCMGDDILRERYCYDELSYTSEDISCSEYMDGYICENDECVLDTTPTTPIIGGGDDDDEEAIETDCGDGIDNDDDGLIDCADTDCDFPFEDGGCGDFDYSCEHNPTTDYPFCGGTCPSGETCGDYAIETSSWCSCIPEDETSCVDSTGDGWCEEGYNCVEDGGEYYCEFDTSGDCTDSDGGIDIYVGGYSLDHLGSNYIEYCGFEKGDENTLYEYYCLYGEASDLPTDCSALGLVCIEPYPYPAYCGEPIF